MSLFRSLGRAIARVWNAPELKEVRHDAEVAARKAVQREINEIILRNMGGPITAGVVRALIGIDKLNDTDSVAAAGQLMELKASLERGIFLMARLKPSRIIVHCSASNWGDLWDIDRWHAQRGFGVELPGDPEQWVKVYGQQVHILHIGYHGLILNGYRTYAHWAHKRPVPQDDGFIQPGRPDYVMGAHCSAKGQNLVALGVCCVSNPGVCPVTRRQWLALVHWCVVKCVKHAISPEQIYEHSDFDKGKPYCASIDVSKLRAEVSAAMVVARLAAANSGK